MTPRRRRRETLKGRFLLVLLFAVWTAVPTSVQETRGRPPRTPVRHTRICEGSYDTIARGGYVLTGDGTEAARADVAITGDRVACVGRVDAPGTATVIDANGLYVAPGFVDVHSHADGTIVAHPDAANLLAQGITTVVGGNCGSHQLPLAELFATVARQGTGVNLASLAGHNSIRYHVMRYQVSPVGSQLDEMKTLVEEEMRSGAVGLSTGLAYRPGNLSTTEEVVALAAVAARYGGDLRNAHARRRERRPGLRPRGDSDRRGQPDATPDLSHQVDQRGHLGPDAPDS